MGEALGRGRAQTTTQSTTRERASRARRLAIKTINVLILTVLTTTLVWWMVKRPENAASTTVALVLVLSTLWGVVAFLRRKSDQRTIGKTGHVHPLIAHDQQGFMKDLELRQKTVIFDGSNLYHFGLSEDLGTRAVALIARQLRTEGYRVVCFFDANIHYKLIENGAAPENQRHSVQTLMGCFDLNRDEIYVVPAGVQADRFILDSLKHLPHSFAVSNDFFRDYAKTYKTIMVGDQWRKGIVVTKNEIRIIKHRFTAPVYVS